MNLKAILILCFITWCYAQHNILVGNLAITLVPGTPRPTLIYKPLSSLLDHKQVWNITSAGYIYSLAPGYTQYVWDIKQKLTTANTPVILYTLSTPAATNQKWIYNTTTGTIKSQMGTNYFVGGPNAINTVNMTYSAPAVFQVKTPVTKPWICQSIGDPHISAYTTGRNDLWTPGSQQPGVYFLSQTGKSLVIQADQQFCYPPRAPYCNKRVILRTQGKLVEINCEDVIINGVTVSPFTGTYNAGNGVSVTKNGRGIYTINYPDGYTQSSCFDLVRKNVNIVVVVTAGDAPSAGVCTEYVGGNVPSKRAILSPYQFCLSWRAKNRTEDLFTYNSDLAWRIANPLVFPTNNGNFTTPNATLRAVAINACAEIAPGSPLVAQCAGHVDTSPADYYQSCLDDVIGMEDPSYAAHIVGAFAKKCSAYANPTIINLPTSGPDSVADGPGLESVTPNGQATNFTISAKDVNGNQVTTGNDTFVVYNDGPAVLTFTQVNLGNGYYRVFYTPTVSGNYNIFVSYKNLNQILNSPFAETVEPIVIKYSIAGYIRSAIDNNAIAGATVFVNSTSVTTDSNGRYEVTGLIAGTYVISASASGFYNGQQTVTIVSASIPAGTTGDLSLSPVLGVGQYRAVLTWGVSPVDLDFQLVTPSCYVYYGNPSCGGATLDVDKTTGFGPETISVSTAPTGLYLFYVENFSNETPLPASNGRIQVYGTSGLIADIHVPTAPSTFIYWKAFTIDEHGTVIIINQVVSSI